MVLSSWLKARNPRTISDLNEGFKSWVRDDNENDFLDVYNDFDFRDQSADDDSQGDESQGDNEPCLK